MKAVLTIALLLVSAGSFADDKIVNQPSKESVNYCHDEIEAKKWEGMLIKYEKEPDIMMLYGLRIGLCQAVDDKKIKLDDAIAVFEIERNRIVREWEEETRKNKAKKEINI